MKKVPNRIREIRKSRALTQAELGDYVGLSAAQISRIETGMRQLSTRHLNMFAGVLDCARIDLLSPDEKSPKGPQRVPIAGWTTAGQFANATTNQGHINDYIWAMTPTPRCFALQVEGTSMSLEAPPGAYLIINPDDKDLVDRKLYVFANSAHDATFKRYRSSDGPPRLEPSSHDPSHETIYPAGEISVIGRVSQILRFV